MSFYTQELVALKLLVDVFGRKKEGQRPKTRFIYPSSW
jgi:hypothetical protein